MNCVQSTGYASFENGVNPGTFTVKFNLGNISNPTMLIPVLQGWDIWFDNKEHQFNRAMVIVSNATFGAPTAYVTCTVMLRDEDGDDPFNAKVWIALFYW